METQTSVRIMLIERCMSLYLVSGHLRSKDRRRGHEDETDIERGYGNIGSVPSGTKVTLKAVRSACLGSVVSISSRIR